MALQVTLLPVLDDNYIFKLTCSKTGVIAVVDPAEAQAVDDALDVGTQVDIILNTHHHGDHTGGNRRLQETYGCAIFGSQYDAEHKRIPGLTHAVKEDDTVMVGESVGVVIETPGHTLGHIAYWFPEEHMLFCGDTLFAGGCGRLFEGTPEQMFLSLWKLKALPPQTQVFCAHEYTEENYRFLAEAAPQNAAVAARKAEVEQLRRHNKPTVPTTLLTELGSNLFLKAETVAEFAALRRAKDVF